jgi:hypothetical protein
MGKYHNRILDLIDEGVIDTKKLAQDLLGWMTDEDIHQFAQQNDYTSVLQEPIEKFSIEDLEVPNFFSDDNDGSFYAKSEFLTIDDGMTGPILNVSFDWEEKECGLSFESYNNSKELVKFSFEDFDDVQEKINNLSDFILSEWKKYYEDQNGKKEV